MNASPSLIPPEWQEKFLLKRIDEQDIELTLEQRDLVLQSLIQGTRFVQISKYTIMLNSIKSIDPKWGDRNIPPRPTPKYIAEENELGGYSKIAVNQDRIDLWDKLFTINALQKTLTVLLFFFFIFCVKPIHATTITRKVIVSQSVARSSVELKSPIPKKKATSTRPTSEPKVTGEVSSKKLPVQQAYSPRPVTTGLRVELPEFKKEVARQIKQAFPNDAREMIAIAMAESGLRCEAINHADSNGVQAVGLFQINDGRWFSEQDIANLSDCAHNIERAKTKYSYGRFNPWGAYWNGAYQRYLWIYDQI